MKMEWKRPIWEVVGKLGLYVLIWQNVIKEILFSNADIKKASDSP